MNDQIVKLFGAIVLLFALLVFFTSRWTVFSASALNRNTLNKRTLIAQERIKRGAILADNGTVLAHSVSAGGGTWRTTYPGGSLYAQTVGYWNGSGDNAGLELYYSGRLEGSTSTVSSVFGPLSSHVQQGDTLHTTLDPQAMAVARRDLDGRTGSVVALDPRTGAVLAMYSNPTFDQDDPGHDCVNACQVNRAVNSAYPPGSTFKIVTAAGAINTGKFTPNSELDGNSPRTISGVPLENDEDQSFGDVSLSYALTQSINTVWAQVGDDLGIPTMTEYMKRYGFYARPPIDLPAAELRASNVISPAGATYPAGSQDEDIGRIAIGQGGLAVTPLQMAMVASAVADGGRLETPHLASRFTNSSGQTVATIHPRLYHRVMSATSAEEINQMMRTVVDEGTGQAAQLGSGIQFAGKTGTASVGPTGEDLTQPWFIGFAPANDPKVAVAVDIERTDDGYGGQVAAPIARDVVQTLLDEGK